MTYKEACAKACEGCREDSPIVGHTHWGRNDEVSDCAAPTRDEHEAGLLTRIAELEADKARLDWMETNDGELSSEQIADNPSDDDTEFHDGWAVYASVEIVPGKRRVVSATADTLREAIDIAMGLPK